MASNTRSKQAQRDREPEILQVEEKDLVEDADSD